MPSSFCPIARCAALLLWSAVASAACSGTAITVDDKRQAESKPAPAVAPPTSNSPPDAGEPVPTVAPSTPASTPDAGGPDAGPPSSAIDLESGLLLHLPFDETEVGATVLDASGNGHDGVPSVDPPVPSPVTPPVGFDNPRSLVFNGVSQLVDLGKPEALDVSGNVTIAAWIRPRASDGYYNIVAHGFRRDPGGELALRIHDGYYEFLSWTGNDHWARAPMVEGDLDSWHHITGVYDRPMYRLFRDGKLLAEGEDSVAPESFDALWAIGGRAESTPEEPRYFDGFIDEVRVYGRALSDDEVRALARQ